MPFNNCHCMLSLGQKHQIAKSGRNFLLHARHIQSSNSRPLTFRGQILCSPTGIQILSPCRQNVEITSARNLHQSPINIQRQRTKPDNPGKTGFLLQWWRSHYHGSHSNSSQMGESLSKSGAAFKGADEVTGWQMMRSMVQYVWPDDAPEVRKKVQIALGLLVGAKVLNISVPFLFKHTVDQLNALAQNPLNFDTPESTAMTVTFALIIGYGISRAGAAGMSELRNAVFARVAQHSVRTIADRVFR